MASDSDLFFGKCDFLIGDAPAAQLRGDMSVPAPVRIETT